MTLPSRVAIDAWPGKPARGKRAGGAADWGARRDGLIRSQQPLEFEEPVDANQWDDQHVGYGVLLRDDDRGRTVDKVAGTDPLVPSAVRKLLDARPRTVLLWWSPASGDEKVVRYFADRTQPLDIGLTSFGVGKNRLPRYVLIVGGPEVIPWSVQYAFAVRHAVGRLPFADQRLDSYLETMIDDWGDSAVDLRSPVLWSTDHGARDITRLMRSVFSSPLERAFSGTLPGMTHLAGADATADNLLERMRPSAASPPALVVTSSHGATPTDPDVLRGTLGLPVDQDRRTVDVEDLDNAMPAGAVWFAQACCSAGGAGESHYEGLLEPESVPAVITELIASLGPVVSPAVLRMLGRPKPVRAIFGHVEPTFDWSLRDPESGQNFATELITGLSSNLHHGTPLGQILSRLSQRHWRAEHQMGEWQARLPGRRRCTPVSDDALAADGDRSPEPRTSGRPNGHPAEDLITVRIEGRAAVAGAVAATRGRMMHRSPPDPAIAGTAIGGAGAVVAASLAR